jgi:hypothetical protein
MPEYADFFSHKNIFIDCQKSISKLHQNYKVFRSSLTNLNQYFLSMHLKYAKFGAALSYEYLKVSHPLLQSFFAKKLLESLQRHFSKTPMK